MAKIAVFIPSLVGGGAERVAVSLANEIARQGHQTQLVVATKSQEKYAGEINDLVQVHRLDASRLVTSTLKLAGYIKKQQPDAILAIMDYASVIARFAITLSRSANTRLYIRESISIEFKADSTQDTAQGIFFSVLNRLIYRTYSYSDGIISPSSELAISLRKEYPLQKNIKHINSPVVTDQFDKLANENSIILPWQQDATIIISAGRLSKQKDFTTLLKAFKLIRKKIDCKLVILGEGSEREILQNYMENNKLIEHCYLPGFIVNPLPYFRRADLFVLSSMYEGLPNALIQALACGTKTISTDCPTGPLEILNNGRFGALIPVGDHKRMAFEIEKSLLCSDGDHKKIANEIKSTYDATTVVAELLKFMLDDTDI